MYPIAALKNLPTGGTISGGVNFSPDGLELTIPATLTIQLPASVDPRKAVPIAYSGNGDNLHLDLGTVAGQTITTRVYHFSGTALGNRIITDLLKANPLLTNTTTDFQRRMANAFWNAEANNTSPLADYNLILRNWYDLIVKPKLTTGGAPGSSIRDINRAFAEYNAWLDAILYAQRTLGDPAYNVQPQNSESEPLAVTLLKRWYTFWNDGCVRSKNNALDDFSVAPGGEFMSPLYDASIALDAGNEADEWHIAKAPNGLDTQTLLNNLCAKVVIESKSYDGNEPGADGTVKVKPGFTIHGGPVRHDATIRVKIGGNGNLFQGDEFSVNGSTINKGVHWPLGVNPLKIDILASLKDYSNIAVFDRITKTGSSSGGGDFAGTFVGQAQNDIKAFPVRIDVSQSGNIVVVVVHPTAPPEDLTATLRFQATLELPAPPPGTRVNVIGIDNVPDDRAFFSLVDGQVTSFECHFLDAGNTFGSNVTIKGTKTN
jgi:hypothetical protein